MSKEKQIEEMADDLMACHTEFETGVGEIYTDYDITAQKMFAKGYRKRIESKWIKRGNVRQCPNCKYIYYSNGDEWRFCSCCGANMKGGAE